MIEHHMQTSPSYGYVVEEWDTYLVDKWSLVVHELYIMGLGGISGFI